MPRKEVIIPPNVLETRKRAGYSQAIKAGNTIYLAGMVAWDEAGNIVGVGDFAAQARQCYENIKRTLAAAGASLEDIVWMTFLNKDVRLWPQQYPVWKEYFGRHYPAGTCIQVGDLFQPELLLEVQAIAVVGEKEVVIPPDVFESRKKAGYSQGIKAGNTVYLAGMVAWDEAGDIVGVGDFAAQARQCYENIKRTLAAAGAGLEDVVWMTFFNRDIRLWPQQYPVRKEYFGRHYPAATSVQAANLCQPELLLEVQAIAVIGDKEIIVPPDVFYTRDGKTRHYSQGIKVGNTIYLAGMVAWDDTGDVVGAGDFAAQTRQCYENIKRTLAAAGASLEDVVWMTFLNKDVRLWPQQYPVWKEYFGRHYPAGTCVQIANLGDPGTLFEVQAIAVVEDE